MTYKKWPEWANPVFAMLCGRKLLIAPAITPDASQVITLKAALKVGLELEPRVLEVLSAAIIHFPENFSDLTKMPKKLRKVIDSIQAHKTDGPDLGCIPYEAMKRWVNVVADWQD